MSYEASQMNSTKFNRLVKAHIRRLTGLSILAEVKFNITIIKLQQVIFINIEILIFALFHIKFLIWSFWDINKRNNHGFKMPIVLTWNIDDYIALYVPSLLSYFKCVCENVTPSRIRIYSTAESMKCFSQFWNK